MVVIELTEKIYKIEGEYNEREQKLGFGRWITR